MNVRLDCVAPLPALRRTRGRCLMSRAGCTRPITRCTRDTYSLVENCAAASRCTRQHFFFFLLLRTNPNRHLAEIEEPKSRSWRSLLIKRAAQRLSTYDDIYIYRIYRISNLFPLFERDKPTIRKLSLVLRSAIIFSRVERSDIR